MSFFEDLWAEHLDGNADSCLYGWPHWRDDHDCACVRPAGHRGNHRCSCGVRLVRFE